MAKKNHETWDVVVVSDDRPAGVVHIQGRQRLLRWRTPVRSVTFGEFDIVSEDDLLGALVVDERPEEPTSGGGAAPMAVRSHGEREEDERDGDPQEDDEGRRRAAGLVLRRRPRRLVVVVEVRARGDVPRVVRRADELGRGQRDDGARDGVAANALRRAAAERDRLVGVPRDRRGREGRVVRRGALGPAVADGPRRRRYGAADAERVGGGARPRVVGAARRVVEDDVGVASRRGGAIVVIFADRDVARVVRGSFGVQSDGEVDGGVVGLEARARRRAAAPPVGRRAPRGAHGQRVPRLARLPAHEPRVAARGRVRHVVVAATLVVDAGGLAARRPRVPRDRRGFFFFFFFIVRSTADDAGGVVERGRVGAAVRGGLVRGAAARRGERGVDGVVRDEVPAGGARGSRAVRVERRGEGGARGLVRDRGIAVVRAERDGGLLAAREQRRRGVDADGEAAKRR
mmetsp:Transcript_16249/g.65633  ORF Transcript_16249/g.65633 Transcript_16249/m.65633 type:complete len:459 (-) Transcript_16249:657-2033(-)